MLYTAATSCAQTDSGEELLRALVSRSQTEADRRACDDGDIPKSRSAKNRRLCKRAGKLARPFGVITPLGANDPALGIQPMSPPPTVKSVRLVRRVRPGLAGLRRRRLDTGADPRADPLRYGHASGRHGRPKRANNAVASALIVPSFVDREQPMRSTPLRTSCSFRCGQCCTLLTSINSSRSAVALTGVSAGDAGAPPFHGYAAGTFSSRKLERTSEHDAIFAFSPAFDGSFETLGGRQTRYAERT